MIDGDMPPEADRVLQDVAALIVEDEKYRDRSWHAMSLAAIVTDTSVDMTGFSYADGAKPKPGTPRNGQIMDKLRTLRTLTRRDGQAPWKAVLIQIRKSDTSVRVWFEYDDADRWKATPGNLAEIKEQLRPR